MYQLCPVCRQYKPEYDCSCTCVDESLISRSEIALVDEKLIDIALKLMDKGFKVNECKIVDVPFYQVLGVEIQLLDLYGKEFFSCLPPGWRVEQYQYPMLFETKVFTVLRDAITWSTPEDNAFELTLTISNLECWLDNIDDNGSKAVLTLAGYYFGPIKLL